MSKTMWWWLTRRKGLCKSSVCPARKHIRNVRCVEWKHISNHKYACHKCDFRTNDYLKLRDHVCTLQP